MLTLDTDQLSTQEIQQYLQYAIAPRPICFASTIDLEGNVNLSPFSFFNLFSMNPPVCIFSPSRRVRDNTTKHTLENIRKVPECVINIVNYEMVHQISLASCDYPKGTNEFIKAGFTPLASELVKPPRVAEAPIQLECIVQEVISLGENAGAGNLVLALIKKIHIKEEVLDANKNIDQTKLDLVARLGGDWYARITEENLFKVEKPNTKLGIGFDQLPVGIIVSELLSNNEKGQLANYNILPESNVQQISNFSGPAILKIKLALANQDTELAWKIIRTSI
ncbi:MAG: flavin reductase family protein [Chitinophagaceae bacterium]|jgi:flavin reductase (DIM6/NTAB) family NADH-FMN oxidoreductase RutF|nr:MAG: flavin reductase family protein [Chitinophagaceae bacterium]